MVEELTLGKSDFGRVVEELTREAGQAFWFRILLVLYGFVLENSLSDFRVNWIKLGVRNSENTTTLDLFILRQQSDNFITRVSEVCFGLTTVKTRHVTYLRPPQTNRVLVVVAGCHCLLQNLPVDFSEVSFRYMDLPFLAVLRDTPILLLSADGFLAQTSYNYGG